MRRQITGKILLFKPETRKMIKMVIIEVLHHPAKKSYFMHRQNETYILQSMLHKAILSLILPVTKPVHINSAFYQICGLRAKHYSNLLLLNVSLNPFSAKHP